MLARSIVMGDARRMASWRIYRNDRPDPEAKFLTVEEAKELAQDYVQTEDVVLRNNNTGDYHRYDRETGLWVSGRENR